MPKKTKKVQESKYINKKTKKPLKVADMLYAVPWENIEGVMYAKDWKAFNKFMAGQTTDGQGAYICDVEDFLRGYKDSF